MSKYGLIQASNLYAEMKRLITKKETFNDAIEICKQLVTLYHKSENGNSIEDLLWNGLNFEQCAESIEDQKCSTIGFNLWHTARFEDIFGSIILQDGEEIFYKDGWEDKILKGFTSTGNALNLTERIELSKKIDYPLLLTYRE